MLAFSTRKNRLSPCRSAMLATGDVTLARRLQLDNLRTQPGQHLGAGGSRLIVRHVDDADAFEGAAHALAPCRSESLCRNPSALMREGLLGDAGVSSAPGRRGARSEVRAAGCTGRRRASERRRIATTRWRSFGGIRTTVPGPQITGPSSPRVTSHSPSSTYMTWCSVSWKCGSASPPGCTVPRFISNLPQNAPSTSRTFKVPRWSGGT